MNKAIILAGGTGSRFLSKIPKQFICINGKAMIHHIIDACLLSHSINSIIIVCHKSWVNMVKELIKDFSSVPKKKIEIVIGGKTRMESTLIGFEYSRLKPEGSIILLEANRPCVDACNIDKLHSYFSSSFVDCAFYFSKIKESIFCIENKNKLNNVDKSLYMITQTPYIFSYRAVEDIIFSLKEKMPSDEKDIISFISVSRKKVFIESDFNNIKITHPQDAIFAEFISRTEYESN